jgi:hypothetical protein
MTRYGTTCVIMLSSHMPRTRGTMHHADFSSGRSCAMIRSSSLTICS